MFNACYSPADDECEFTNWTRVEVILMRLDPSETQKKLTYKNAAKISPGIWSVAIEKTGFHLIDFLVLRRQFVLSQHVLSNMRSFLDTDSLGKKKDRSYMRQISLLSVVEVPRRNKFARKAMKIWTPLRHSSLYWMLLKNRQSPFDL